MIVPLMLADYSVCGAATKSFPRLSASDTGGHAAAIVQTLLHYGPFAIIRQPQNCAGKFEIRRRSALLVDPRGQPAGADQSFRVKAAALGN